MNIIKLAEQAGFMLVTGDAFDENAWFECFPDQIKRFAELVAAAEREKCAKLCESMGVYPELNVWNGGPDWYKRQKECAAAIRARGET